MGGPARHRGEPEAGMRTLLFAAVGLVAGAFVGYVAGMYVACYLLWPESNLSGRRPSLRPGGPPGRLSDGHEFLASPTGSFTIPSCGTPGSAPRQRGPAAVSPATASHKSGHRTPRTQGRRTAMSMPNAMSKQPAADEPTGPYQGGGASPGRPAGRIKVALVSGSGPAPTSELQTLLRKRLRIITLIWLVGIAVFLPFEFFQSELTPET